jgi:hypothetical protein
MERMPRPVPERRLPSQIYIMVGFDLHDATMLLKVALEREIRGCRLHHRHDPRLHRFRQIGPRFIHRSQIGVNLLCADRTPCIHVCTLFMSLLGLRRVQPMYKACHISL